MKDCPVPYGPGLLLCHLIRHGFAAPPSPRRGRLLETDSCLHRSRQGMGEVAFCPLGKMTEGEGNPPLLPPLHKGGFLTPDRRGRRPRRPAPSCQSTEPPPLVIPTEPFFPSCHPDRAQRAEGSGNGLPCSRDFSARSLCSLGRNDKGERGRFAP